MSYLQLLEHLLFNLIDRKMSACNNDLLELIFIQVSICVSFVH